MVWRYSQKEVHDMVQRLVKEIGKTNPLIMRLILSQCYDYSKLSDAVREYFLGMNDYAFITLSSVMEEDMNNSDGDCDFSIEGMKKRIIKIMRGYAKMNGLEGMGICPASQVNYLAEKTSDYFRMKYEDTSSSEENRVLYDRLGLFSNNK